jgi:hypothetical protein
MEPEFTRLFLMTRITLNAIASHRTSLSGLIKFVYQLRVMKKIIIAFDGTNFSEASFEFVLRLNQLSPIMLTGVFMPLVNYAGMWSYATTNESEPALIPLVEEYESELVENNIERFKNLCDINEITYKVHKDYSDFVLPELKKESRFADLIILDGTSFFNEVRENRFEYLRDAIHDAECPVLIVPDHFTFPDNNVLAYDGSEESVYAIKQFIYLFPELTKNKTLLVYADDEYKNLPAEDSIIELMTPHFKDLTFYRLETEAKKYFSTWMNDKQGSILVCGSFSRSAFSQLFRKSFVADVIKEHKVPVFIAHK